MWKMNHFRHQSWDLYPMVFSEREANALPKSLVGKPVAVEGMLWGLLWVWVEHVVHSETSTGEITFSTTGCETRNKSVKFLPRSEYGCLKLG